MRFLHSLANLLTLFAGAIASPTTAVTVQAGLHVIYSYAGTTPPSPLLDLTRQGKVGGIILFSDNVDGNIASHVASIQAAYRQSPAYSAANHAPLLIMTDQEGGEVRRLPGGPTLSEKQIGSSANPSSAATTAGQQAASALHSAAVNANLSPVLDVYRQPGDFDDQYGRSYSNNSGVVATCGAAFVSAQQGAGVLATAKHFPGLGAAAANQNTDEAPVTLNVPLDQLRAVDEMPFQTAIASGKVDMVMTSWALYPALDATYPSGLSSKWIQGELRGRLGFAGVTISDAIEAGGLNAFGTNDAHRAVLASQAGLDLILAGARDYTQGSTIVDGLVASLNNGTLSKSAFDAATQRIVSLRAKLL